MTSIIQHIMNDHARNYKEKDKVISPVARTIINCRVCNLAFYTDLNLFFLKHFDKIHKGKPKMGNVDFACRMCPDPEVFSSSQALKDHLIGQHGSEELPGRTSAKARLGQRRMHIDGINKYLKQPAAPRRPVQDRLGEKEVVEVKEVRKRFEKRVYKNWNCPACKYLNFENNTECHKCYKPKPKEGKVVEKKAIKEVTESTTDIFKMQIEMMMKNERDKMDLAEFIINDLIENAVLQMREDCFDCYEEDGDGEAEAEDGEIENVSSPEYRIDSDDDDDRYPNEAEEDVGNQDDKLENSMDVDQNETLQDKRKDSESVKNDRTDCMKDAKDEGENGDKERNCINLFTEYNTDEETGDDIAKEKDETESQDNESVGKKQLLARIEDQVDEGQKDLVDSSFQEEEYVTGHEEGQDNTLTYNQIEYDTGNDVDKNMIVTEEGDAIIQEEHNNVNEISDINVDEVDFDTGKDINAKEGQDKGNIQVECDTANEANKDVNNGEEGNAIYIVEDNVGIVESKAITDNEEGQGEESSTIECDAGNEVGIEECQSGAVDLVEGDTADKEDDIMGQILEKVESTAGEISEGDATEDFQTKEVKSEDAEVGNDVEDEIVSKKSKRKNAKTKSKKINDDKSNEMVTESDDVEDASVKRSTRLRSRRKK